MNSYYNFSFSYYLKYFFDSLSKLKSLFPTPQNHAIPYQYNSKEVFSNFYLQHDDFRSVKALTMDYQVVVASQAQNCRF